MAKKKKNLSVLNLAQKNKNTPKLVDPDDLQSAHPRLLEAVKQVYEGDWPVTVAKEHGIPSQEFLRFCRLNGVLKKRAKNPIAAVAAIQDKIDVDSALHDANGSDILKWILEAAKFIHASQGGTTSRQEITFSSPLDKFVSSLTPAEREEALKYLESQIIDVEPEE